TPTRWADTPTHANPSVRMSGDAVPTSNPAVTFCQFTITVPLHRDASAGRTTSILVVKGRCPRRSRGPTAVKPQLGSGLHFVGGGCAGEEELLLQVSHPGQILDRCRERPPVGSTHDRTDNRCR